MEAVGWASPTGEQRELASAVADLAADRCSPAHRRSVAASDDQWDPALWRTVAVDMGLAGVAVPEANGGAGGDFADAAVLVEAAAQGLLPVPVTAQVVAAEALRPVASDPAAAASLTELAAGAVVGTLAVAAASGTAARVLHGGVAELLVVAEPDALRVVRRGTSGVEVTPQSGIDLTRPHATVRLTDAAAGHVVGDRRASQRAVDVLRVCLAAEGVGVARAALQLTVGYLQVREQFGRPIGTFQALQHRAADLLVELEAAVSAARYAAAVVAEGTAEADAELGVVSPVAKAVCTEAAWHIAAEAIQLHGGIGFTWEHDAHLYFKRATALRALLGSPAEHRRLVAVRAGLT